MGVLKDFRDFAMRGNVIDLAIGVIIGAAFGSVTKSMVDDILMPPIGKLVGNLDFANLYISLSAKVNAANQALLQQTTAPQSAAGTAVLGAVTQAFDTATRLPLAEARKLGPVIAYGNFITMVINFIIVAFCVFLVVKLMTITKQRFDKEQATAPAAPPADVQLLTEIRDILRQK